VVSQLLPLSTPPAISPERTRLNDFPGRFGKRKDSDPHHKDPPAAIAAE